MTVELTEGEQQELIFLVDERLRTLRTEISHTVTHDFKLVLKDREHLLERIGDKLKVKEAVY